MVHFKPKQVGKGLEIQKIKIIVSFRFVPAQHVIENSIKIVKIIQKIKEIPLWFISNQNRLEKDENERKKNYRSVSFLPDA